MSLKKIGFSLQPPTLHLIYKDRATQKMRDRKVPIRLKSSVPSERVVTMLFSAHGDLLYENCSPAHMLTLIEKMRSKLASSSTTTSGEETVRMKPNTALDISFSEEEEDDPDTLLEGVDLHGDLNKISEDQLRAAKARMEEEFRKHQLRPGDEGYVWDTRKDFQPSEDAGWDEEEEEEEEDDDDDAF
jgi:hypothetical protein